MQVILLDTVEKLGNLGEKIHVKAGYARNFLIPHGKAVPATKKNVEYFEARRAEIEAKLLHMKNIAEERAEKIKKLNSITIVSKTGHEGKLFGSIGTRDIAKAINAAGINVSKNEIRLPNGVLRNVGLHEIRIYIYSEFFVTLNIIVAPAG